MSWATPANRIVSTCLTLDVMGKEIGELGMRCVTGRPLFLWVDGNAVCSREAWNTPRGHLRDRDHGDLSPVDRAKCRRARLRKLL